MGTAYLVQAYKAKGTRLVGQASESYGYADEALAAAKRLARWRAGIVVLKREVDDEGIPRGLPAVLAIHGTVPDGWLAGDGVTPDRLVRVEAGSPRPDPTALPGRTPAMLAARLGARLAGKRGAVAFSRTGNLDTGDFGDANVIGIYSKSDRGMLGK